jgi:hypothetical protein
MARLKAIACHESRPPRLFFGTDRIGQRFERLGVKLAVLLEQNFHFTLGVFEFFPAGTGKFHAFLEKRQGLFQGHIALFEFLNDLFQTLKAFFKFRQSRAPRNILIQFREEGRLVVCASSPARLKGAVSSR